jgi:D-serine deaminase-like pyridoxal phosphate-dependent protein
VAQTPSEEHLPLRQARQDAEARPPRGSGLLLVPRHVCPTVNLAEQAVLLDGGRVVDVVAVSARAHDL